MFLPFLNSFPLADGWCGEYRPNLDIRSVSHSSKIAGLSQDFNYCKRHGLATVMNPVAAPR
jgi:hypothetical protein